MRIVSLIASATEILCRLGLRDQLVGRSHECDFPPDIGDLPVLSRPRVDAHKPGGEVDRDVRALVRDALSVYEVDVDALERLAPDLIVTQDHCVVCAVSLGDVEDALCQIADHDATVCTLHPESMQSVYADIQRVAEAAEVGSRGTALVSEMEERIAAVAGRTTNIAEPPRVALIEWLDPPMIAGGWMPELARAAGAQPVIVETPETFATVDWEAIGAADPDVAIVLPCGYELPQSLEALRDDTVRDPLGRLRAVRTGRGFVADGNAYFNRPGPRLADSTEILAAMIHPGHYADFETKYAASYTSWPARNSR